MVKIYCEDISKEEIEGLSSKDKEKVYPIKPYNREQHVMKADEFIFEIPDGKEGTDSVIKIFKEKELVSDKDLLKLLEAKAPDLKSYFSQAPIELSNFKEEMRDLLGDLPDHLFKGRNYIEITAKILEHWLKKEHTNFIITSIDDGRLIFNEECYPIVYHLYYTIAKINHFAPTYRIMIEAWENILEEHFWKVYFSDEEEVRLHGLTLIIKFYNFIGNQYGDMIRIYQRKLKALSKDIEHNKRANYRVPKMYWQDVTTSKRNLQNIVDDFKKCRLKISERKREIVLEYDKKKQIRKEEIDTILGGKFGIFKFALKKLLGGYK